MPDLNKTGFKCQYVWIEDGKRLRIAFPSNSPIWSSAPTIPINEEGIVSVAQEEFACKAFDVDRLDLLLPHDEIERRIGLVKQ